MGMLLANAQAQTVLSSTIDKAHSGQDTISNSYTASLGTYTADGDATITDIVFLIISPPSNVVTLLGQSTMTVDGTSFTYDSYNSTTRRATFTGSVAVNENDTGVINLSCTNCGSGQYFVGGTSEDADGWSFTSTPQKARLQILGTLANAAPVLASIGAQTHRQGGSVSVSPSATDANSGDTLSWSASGLPTGLSINSSLVDGLKVLQLWPSVH